MYLGSATGLGNRVTFAGQDGSFGGFGVAVAGAGDLNGDGYGDVVIGANGASSNTGKAYVYAGSANGLSTTPVALTSPDRAHNSASPLPARMT